MVLAVALTFPPNALAKRRRLTAGWKKPFPLFMKVILQSLALVLWFAAIPASRAAEAVIEDVRRIWDRAPHNAFTDLIRFHDRWFCVFREGQKHVSPDGALRILTSIDGRDWESAALITSEHSDLRDAKICVTPKGELMLSGAGALHDSSTVKHESYAWFSKDGFRWGKPVKIGDPNQWLWRTTWHGKKALSIGYETAGGNFVRLYETRDGRKFRTLVPRLFDREEPNEHSIVFQPDDTALCVMRRDGKPGRALLGRARPPYRDWQWQELGQRIGGPQMIRLPDGRIVVAGRLYEGGVRTSLLWLDPVKGEATEFLKLPSGGDTSYPGLVWHEGKLWVSYYSSHEGKTSIYLARARLPAKP